MSELISMIGIWIAGLVFAAGGAWWALKEAQRHVNGLGSKLNALEKERNDRHTRVCMALVMIARTEEKSAVMQCLSAGETIEK